jgi:hypothetical protein
MATDDNSSEEIFLTVHAAVWCRLDARLDDVKLKPTSVLG